MGWWMFDSQGRYVPCMGVSIGKERLFSILGSSVDKNQRQGEVARKVKMNLGLGMMAQNLMDEFEQA